MSAEGRRKFWSKIMKVNPPETNGFRALCPLLLCLDYARSQKTIMPIMPGIIIIMPVVNPMGTESKVKILNLRKCEKKYLSQLKLTAMLSKKQVCCYLAHKDFMPSKTCPQNAKKTKKKANFCVDTFRHNAQMSGIMPSWHYAWHNA